MRARALLLVATSAFLGACAPDTPTELTNLPAQSFAKGGGNPGGGGGTSLPTQANLVWDDYVGTVATAIHGDQLNREGVEAEPYNEYEGSYCGVYTHLWNGKRDDGRLDFDPDTYYDGTCGPRVLSMDFEGNERFTGTIHTGPQMVVSGVWSVAAGTSVESAVMFGMQGEGPACHLFFDAAYGVRPAIITGIDNGDGTWQWRVTSQPPHEAACVEKLANGRLRDTGARYTLPFSVLVTARP